jgi:hypothetical protein
MNIKFNYVFMQNETMFYLLDLVDHSWTMCLNFGNMVLSLPNLIMAKERTLSSSSTHQNLPIRSNLPLEMGDRRKGWYLVLSTY